MEEYYQQVGRAGRDGLPSTVEMLYGPSDFSKYGSDFYVGNLSASAKAQGGH
jgi:superfamily II DNA helicase RecQ